MYVKEVGSDEMLAAKRSAGVAQEVNFREHVTCLPPPSSNKTTHPGFETQRRRHQKSKTGVSVAPQKGLMSSNLFLKPSSYQIEYLVSICIIKQESIAVGCIPPAI